VFEEPIERDGRHLVGGVPTFSTTAWLLPESLRWKGRCQRVSSPIQSMVSGVLDRLCHKSVSDWSRLKEHVNTPLQDDAFLQGVEVLGDRWTLLIVRQFQVEKSLSFTELLGKIPGIATNMLSSRLAKLVSHGIVRVAADRTDRRKRVYSHTAKAVGVFRVLRAIELWRNKQDSTSQALKK
jgi:DNA-binding HxlR family transcriptional regulator